MSGNRNVIPGKSIGIIYRETSAFEINNTKENGEETGGYFANLGGKY